MTILAMPAPSIHDRGTPIWVRYTDRYVDPGDGMVKARPIDTSAAAQLRLFYHAPSSPDLQHVDAQPSTDPDRPASEGWAVYVPNDTDEAQPSFLARGGAGTWRWWPEYRLGPGLAWRPAEPIWRQVGG